MKENVWLIEKKSVGKKIREIENVIKEKIIELQRLKKLCTHDKKIAWYMGQITSCENSIKIIKEVFGK